VTDPHHRPRRAADLIAARGKRPTYQPGEPNYRRFDDQPPPPVSVVFCTHNDAPTIADVLRRVPSFVKDIVVVDCGSTDRTVELVREAAPRATLLVEESNDRGRAWRSGFARASGDIFVMLRGDGSHDPAEIPRFLAVLRTGADFAIGTRYLAGGGSAEMNRFRWFGDRFLTHLANWVLKARFSDIGYGYLAFWKRQLPDLRVERAKGDLEAVLPLRARRLGIRMVEVPSYESLRHHNPSNAQALREGFAMLRTIVAARRAG
jgi:glycosyltransferase involved in cell wall biosynthesis